MYLNHEELNFLLHQIIRTMGMDPVTEIDDNSYIGMDEGWYIYSPENNTSYVVIGFDDEMDPHDAADIAMRFCRILDLLDVQVIVEDDTHNCDSTAIIESITVIQ